MKSVIFQCSERYLQIMFLDRMALCCLHTCILTPLGISFIHFIYLTIIYARHVPSAKLICHISMGGLQNELNWWELFIAHCIDPLWLCWNPDLCYNPTWAQANEAVLWSIVNIGKRKETARCSWPMSHEMVHVISIYLSLTTASHIALPNLQRARSATLAILCLEGRES